MIVRSRTSRDQRTLSAICRWAGGSMSVTLTAGDMDPPFTVDDHEGLATELETWVREHAGPVRRRLPWLHVQRLPRRLPRLAVHRPSGG